jgi:hypothetical protein
MKLILTIFLLTAVLAGCQKDGMKPPSDETGVSPGPPTISKEGTSQRPSSSRERRSQISTPEKNPATVDEHELERSASSRDQKEHSGQEFLPGMMVVE